jgi:hypothetical protein
MQNKDGCDDDSRPYSLWAGIPVRRPFHRIVYPVKQGMALTPKNKGNGSFYFVVFS